MLPNIALVVEFYVKELSYDWRGIIAHHFLPSFLLAFEAALAFGSLPTFCT
jgi:hypothetical protein